MSAVMQMLAAVFNSDGIEYVGYAGTYSASGTSVVVTKPAGTADGDLMLAFATSNSGSTTWTGPAGWTEGVDTSGRACYSKTASSEGASYTFTPNGSVQATVYIIVYRRAALDVVGAMSIVQSPIVTAPSVSVSSNGSVVIAAYSDALNSGSTFSTPSGFSAFAYNAYNTNAPSSAIFKKSVSSGATGGIDSTVTGVSGSCGFLVAISAV